MSVLMSRPVLRWIVPAFATVAVLGGGAAIGAITAAADPSLPPRSPAQLLVDLQTAGLDNLSGTIVTRADLGLPTLPGLTGGPSGANLENLLTGTHTVRVWYSGPNKARVALLDTLGETDVIANGTDLWTWSSQANEATHRTISGTGIPAHPRDVVPSGGVTPQQLADLALAAINPTTQVTTRGTASIAGRDAYELVLAPRDPTSLIGSVRLAVDAATHVPLRVQIFANSASTPAIEVGFTSVSFARPDPSEFVFNPPPGATVTDGNKPDAGTPDNSPTAPDLGTGKPGFTVIGSGWTSVAVVRAGKLLPPSVLAGLPVVSGAWGSGKLLRSSLLTVLVTDDGRLLVGAVEPERLYTAAADPAAKLPA
jgi:outer membrane lipoprotein-sorting protein